MKEELVTFKTAKLAKEKGFALNSPAFYGCDNPTSGKKGNQLLLRTWENWINFGKESSQEDTMTYFAPTQTILQRWLREKHNIHIVIYANASGWGWILTKIAGNGSTIKEIEDDVFFNDYKEALEIGLQNALKLF